MHTTRGFLCRVSTLQGQGFASFVEITAVWRNRNGEEFHSASKIGGLDGTVDHCGVGWGLASVWVYELSR